MSKQSLDEKECILCHAVQPLDQYRAKKTGKDGLNARCNSCEREYAKHWYKENLERERLKRREHDQNIDGLSKELRNERAKRQYIKDLPKFRARQAVNNAVQAGKLNKPSECTNCGTGGRIEGHHNDYTKPLDVSWLCHKCHKAVHGRIYV